MPLDSKPKKFFVTTPIYYVNARPHIGHAYTTIVADVLARRSRAQGIDTFFLTGTDEHGQKIERSAAAAGIPPQQFADEVSASFQTLWKRMGITNDAYIRTTDAAHKRGVQKLFADLHARGHIYLSSYTGQYSIGEEMFVEGPPGTIGPDGKPTETVTEENFFFRLSDYQLPLLNLIESDTLKITPESRKNEVLSFLRGNVSGSDLKEAVNKDALNKDAVILSEARSAQTKDPEASSLTPIASNLSATNPGAPSFPESQPGKGGAPDEVRPPSPDSPPYPKKSPATLPRTALGTPYLPGALKDLSVSRSSFTWGIPVPEPAASEAKEKHVIYVWLDALANYMTALGYGSEDTTLFDKYWPADLHLVGKEIIRFHCVYWPAFLLALNPALAHAPDEPTPILTSEQHNAWAKKWLPKTVTAHGWLLFDNSKMSKSKGNIVRTETILEAFGTLCPPPAPASTRTTPGAPSTALGAPSQAASPLEVGSIPAHPTPDSVTGGDSLVPHSSQPHRDEWVPTTRSTPVPQPESVILSEAQSAQLNDPDSLIPATAASDLSAPAPLAPTQADRDLFASDVLRYFLLREIPFGQDGSFTFEALITRYNADLANGYGNLVSRTLNMVNKFFGGKIPNGIVKGDQSLRQGFANYDANYQFENGTYEFSKSLEGLANLISATDRYISENAPWKLAKVGTPESTEELGEILHTALDAIRIATVQIHPFMPFTTLRVCHMLGFSDIAQADRAFHPTMRIQTGDPAQPVPVIFPRADKGLAQLMNDLEQKAAEAKAADQTPKPTPSNFVDENFAASPATPLDPTHPGAPPRTGTLSEPNPGLHVAGSGAITTERPGTPPHHEAHPSGIFTAAAPQPAQPADSSPQITIDDFAKIELRVAKILVAERIPKADKLLRLEVDLGYEQRQILSGIAEWYTPEDLIGRRIVVITNLAPRKMRGLESHGMLLAASTEGGKPHLTTCGDSDDLPLGSRLK